MIRINEGDPLPPATPLPRTPEIGTRPVEAMSRAELIQEVGALRARVAQLEGERAGGATR